MYKRETDKCRKCHGLADALVWYQYSSRGDTVGRIIHRIRCRSGCTGLGGGGAHAASPGRSKIVDRSVNIDGMPRPPNPEVRRRLLAAGLDLVHARGFAASAVKDMHLRWGGTHRSVYPYFPHTY